MYKENPMKRCINFNEFLSPLGQQMGYVRQVLAVKEFENQDPGQHYGTISESKYLSDEEMKAFCCQEGDCFIIKNTMVDENFSQRFNLYFLVVVDFERTNNLKLIDCYSKVPYFYSPWEHRYYNEIFVDRLIARGFLKPEKEAMQK